MIRYAVGYCPVGGSAMYDNTATDTAAQTVRGRNQRSCNITPELRRPNRKSAGRVRHAAKFVKMQCGTELLRFTFTNNTVMHVLLF